MALAMTEVLQRRGYEVDSVCDPREVPVLLAQRPYRLLITDLRMPGIDGHELLTRARSLNPNLRVLVVTAYATVQSAVACVRDGAVDYLTKPFSPGALEKAVSAALRGSEPAIEEEEEELDFVASDPAVLETVELATRAAASDVTVLLEGESGVGKELFARLIHQRSPRSSGPFVAVNCASLPRELLEAELFGHSRGAFTGAHRDRKGYFQTADGGTLFLDEIGEMSGDLQARLLRVLQDHRVQPVGGDEPIRVDVRVLAATNRNLREEVAAGRFREDLYYRLSVLPLLVPPLRERPLDIEPLAMRFARRFVGAEARLTERALQKLKSHSWPGNVRELRNCMQRAAILAGAAPIDAAQLRLERPAAVEPAEQPLSLEDAERETIRRILQRTNGNRSEAAAALGISPRTLRHKLKRFRDMGRPVIGVAS